MPVEKSIMPISSMLRMYVHVHASLFVLTIFKRFGRRLDEIMAGIIADFSLISWATLFER